MLLHSLLFVRFETESQRLLEDQEHTKRKRKEEMMERLRNRRRQKTHDSSHEEGEEEEINEAELEEEADRLLQLQVPSLPPLSVDPLLG
jgi:hypothetical protein